MDYEPLMSIEEALLVIRDPSSSIPRQMFAGAALHKVQKSLSTDDLLALLRCYRSAGWWAAYELHDRTGRPKTLNEHGLLVIDADDWKNYLEQTDSKNRP